MDMRKRAMGLSAVIFGTAVGVVTLTAVSGIAVQADDCLAAPDSQPMQGSHWRYRIDGATNRRCWYVQSGASQLAPVASPSMKPVALPTRAALQRSIANSRAEISPIAETVQANNSSGASTESLRNDDLGSDVGPALKAPPRMLGARRQDYANDIARAEAAPPAAVVAGARHRPQPASARQAGRATSGSIRTLLSALAGALALAVAASAVVSKFGGKAIGRTKKRGSERMTWTAQSGGAISSPVTASVRHRDDPSMDRVRSSREAQEASRQAEQIEELLSRAARRSA
jgi:hypothetical protein